MYSFQRRATDWSMHTFDNDVVRDRAERNRRFLEEAGELVQACDMSRDEAHAIIDFVYDRTPGDPFQEVGGVLVTLAVLCHVHGISMPMAAENELARCWNNVARIREKQAAKKDAGAAG